MQQFHVFTMMFGQHYIDLFKKACFKSMCWPKNREALAGHAWYIYTKREHFEELTELFKETPFTLQLMEMTDSMRVAGCGFIKTTQCDDGVILLNGLRDQIALCLKSHSRMLFAPPDTIFGDGTVPNLIALGQVEYSCVAVAHPRVLPTILDPIGYTGATDGPLNNRRLVDLAIKHAHESWSLAEIGHKNNNSYVGGISWQKLSDNLISVTHRLPTPYFMSFHPTDWDFWWGTVSFGALDHSWPGDRLIRQERLRVVGSSDAAFIVEVTAHDKNVPPIIESKYQVDPTNGAYWGDKIHHSVNRLFNVIWRTT